MVVHNVVPVSVNNTVRPIVFQFPHSQHPRPRRVVDVQKSNLDPIAGKIYLLPNRNTSTTVNNITNTNSTRTSYECCVEPTTALFNFLHRTTPTTEHQQLVGRSTYGEQLQQLLSTTKFTTSLHLRATQSSRPPSTCDQHNHHDLPPPALNTIITTSLHLRATQSSCRSSR